MSELILWRHAEAEEGVPDMARQLTQKGRKQAAKMASWLDRQLPANCKILCSPAERTVQTVMALDRKYRVCEALAPESSLQSMLDACRESQRGEPILIVGHQPNLGRMASLLLTGTEQPWTLRKGGILWIAKRGQKFEDEESNILYIKAALIPELAGK